MSPEQRIETVLFDIDGTLDDSNDDPAALHTASRGAGFDRILDSEALSPSPKDTGR